MEFITRKHFEENSDRISQEFANRQLLIRGKGAPDFQAPLHAEYEDESTDPSTRYRKTGPGKYHWTDISLSRLLGLTPMPEEPVILDPHEFIPTKGLVYQLPAHLVGTAVIAVREYGVFGLSDIAGGCVGQVINLHRADTTPLVIQPNDSLRIAGSIALLDRDMLDNITLMRFNRSTWVELTRTTF